MMVEKGVPNQFLSDGGPQFASREFSQFCEDGGITHVRSSPHHHQASDTAEAAVKAMKHLIVKSTSRGNWTLTSFVRR